MPQPTDAGTPVVWLAFVLVYTQRNDLTVPSQATIKSELFDVRQHYTGVTFSRKIVGALMVAEPPHLRSPREARRERMRILKRPVSVSRVPGSTGPTPTRESGLLSLVAHDAHAGR